MAHTVSTTMERAIPFPTSSQSPGSETDGQRLGSLPTSGQCEQGEWNGRLGLHATHGLRWGQS